MRKNGVCVPQRFPQPPKSIRTEVEKSGKNVNSSIPGNKLPFAVAGDPTQLRVMSLDGVHVCQGSGDRVVNFCNQKNSLKKMKK